MPALMIIQGIAESLKAILVIKGYEKQVLELDEHEEEHAL